MDADRRARLGIGVVVAAVLAAGIASVVVARMSPSAPEPPQGTRLFEDLKGEVTDEPVDYDRMPPVGGPHATLPARCGFYDQPIPNENAVHSLAHGAVWITYDPALGAGALDHLRDLAGPKVLVSPWPDGLPGPVVASAWGAQLIGDGPGDPRIEEFIRVFQDSPRSPEPHAPCSGVGRPDRPWRR